MNKYQRRKSKVLKHYGTLYDRIKDFPYINEYRYINKLIIDDLEYKKFMKEAIEQREWAMKYYKTLMEKAYENLSNE